MKAQGGLALTILKVALRLYALINSITAGECLRLFLRQIMPGMRDDAMGAGPVNFAAAAVPSVAGATPSASPSRVMVGTVMTGSAASRR